MGSGHDVMGPAASTERVDPDVPMAVYNLKERLSYESPILFKNDGRGLPPGYAASTHTGLSNRKHTGLSNRKHTGLSNRMVFCKARPLI